MTTVANIDAIKRAVVAHLEYADVPVGLHRMHHLMEIRVTGAARRLPDGMVRSTYKLPLVEVLALVVAKAGVMGPKILELIREAATEAAADEQTRAVSDWIEVTRKAVRTVQDELLSKLPLTSRAGAFKSECEVKMLSCKPLGDVMKELGDESALAG